MNNLLKFTTFIALGMAPLLFLGPDGRFTVGECFIAGAWSTLVMVAFRGREES